MINEILPGLAVELKITGDGSHTLFVPGMNEHYHSVFGAVAESRHIFIETGFNFIQKSGNTIKVLEIGLGTGLNALLTSVESEVQACRVEYTAIELYPLKEEIYSRLNYARMLKSPGVTGIFKHIHDFPWNERAQLTGIFSLLKMNISLQFFQPEKGSFDIVYFDAFGPDVQPDMWTGEMFIKMAYGLKRGGILVTYSTKGLVKRNISGAGFTIEKLPGPPGKREILRAVKI